MAVTSASKWSCPTCTYNNWQSCSKCVLCGSSKPIDDVIPRTPVAKYRQQNSGWSKLASHPGGVSPAQFPANTAATLESSNGNVGPKGSVKCKTKGKWTCGSCTYLNWPNAGQCTTCGAPRTRATALRNEAGRTPTRSSDSILLYPSGGGAVGGGASVTGSCDIPVRTKNGRHGNRSGQGAGGSGGGGGNGENRKWKCQRCTYENWPRASKCTMCLGPKTRTPSPPLSGTEDSTLLTTPPSSPHLLQQQGRLSSQARAPSPLLPPTPNPAPTLNSNTSLSSSSSSSSIATSPTTSRTHSNSNATCEANSGTGTGFNANKLASSSNMQASKDILTDPSRERRHSTPRQIQLKSDTDEVRQIRNTLSSSDWLFLNACLGIINSEVPAVKAYLRQDGDRARQLTKNECLVLGQPSMFTIGSTLVHLAIRFQRSEMLSLLLTPAPSDARKRLPSESNPDLASSIREEVGLSLHQHKGDWPCYFLTQSTTFFLPADIRRFCSAVQKRVLDEIVDKDVAKELEAELAIINWSAELVDHLHSKLYPLWNRTAGDCLLDSVLQATWGVVDRDSTLRRAMADSLVDGASSFYSRWKDSEQRLSQSQGFVLDEDQLKQDWAAVLALADQTGRSLEQIHIFALAHILRRPIIVYGVRVVKNYRGENLGFANFEGVYLPLLWEASFCWKTPIALGYTRGHFSALVAIASSAQSGAGKCSSNQTSQCSHVTYFPLVDSEGRLLCVHFLSEQEIGCEERLLTEYCDCYLTPLGTLTAKQELSGQQQHSLVVSLVDQWLERFRKMDKRREAAASSSSAHSDSGSDH